MRPQTGALGAQGFPQLVRREDADPWPSASSVRPPRRPPDQRPVEQRSSCYKANGSARSIAILPTSNPHPTLCAPQHTISTEFHVKQSLLDLRCSQHLHPPIEARKAGSRGSAAPLASLLLVARVAQS